MTSDHEGPRAVDFNDGSRVVLEGDVLVNPTWVIYDESHAFLRQVQQVDRRAYGKQARMAELMAQQMGVAIADAAKALAQLLESWPKVPIVPFAREHLNNWAAPPETVMERAIAARKTRNTGPARPSGPSARRPRRHQ